jgi:CRISPR-associated endonuclease Csn1
MKPNRQLVNETLQSTREIDGKEMIVGKMKSLYEVPNAQSTSKNLKKWVKESPEKFLMYHHDPKTFENLKQIVEKYDDAKNPLQKYFEEEGEYLRKYSKNGNGPIVKSLKYYQRALGAHMDITKNYEDSSKKVVLLSLTPFRMDVYFEEDHYKFISLTMKDLVEKKDAYIIDQEHYQKKMDELGIKDRNNFQFSLYKNDVLQFDGEIYRLIGHDDSRRKLEFNTVKYDYKEYCKNNEIKSNRIFKTVGKSVQEFSKVHQDILGNTFVSKTEKFKGTYKK